VAAAVGNALLVAPALAEPGKIFDFNLTLPLMAGQFLVLMVILDKLVYTPVGKVLDDRDAVLRSKLEAVKDNSADLLKYTVRPRRGRPGRSARARAAGALHARPRGSVPRARRACGEPGRLRHACAAARTQRCICARRPQKRTPPLSHPSLACPPASQEEADKIIGAARNDAGAAIAKAKAAADAESAVKVAAAKAKLDAELKTASAALEAQRQTSLASIDAEVNKLSEFIIKKLIPA
jgi:F0F1-type ATP synthase membrane subunit b/b'